MPFPNAENTAGENILSKVDRNSAERVNTIVEAQGSKPLDITVEVESTLPEKKKTANPEKLVNEACQNSSKGH